MPPLCALLHLVVYILLRRGTSAFYVRPLRAPPFPPRRSLGFPSDITAGERAHTEKLFPKWKSRTLFGPRARADKDTYSRERAKWRASIRRPSIIDSLLPGPIRGLFALLPRIRFLGRRSNDGHCPSRWMQNARMSFVQTLLRGRCCRFYRNCSRREFFFFFYIFIIYFNTPWEILKGKKFLKMLSIQGISCNVFTCNRKIQW